MRLSWIFLIFLACQLLNVSFGTTDDGTIIGIDIGNTFSSVGIYRNGIVEIVENELGEKLIPSIVTICKNENCSDSPLSVFDLKYLLGKSYEDKIIQENLENWPFKVTNYHDQLKIEVPTSSELQFYTPETLTSFLIKQLKKVAESHLQEKVHSCVIAHPVYFDHDQRIAIKEAAKQAGLNVIRMIKEPIAAAKAFEMDKKGNNRNILVYHLGGATLDVTLVTFEDGVFEVKANRGSRSLGGRTFNRRIVDYLRKELDVLDQKAIKTLGENVENAKIALSTQDQVQIELGNKELMILTREKFEELNMDLFQNTVTSINKVLEDSLLNKTDIHDVILIGGSTKIPKIRELVTKFFDEKEPVTGVEPDLAVVTGTVLTAGKIQSPEKTMFESSVEWIVSKLTRSSSHDELK